MSRDALELVALCGATLGYAASVAGLYLLWPPLAPLVGGLVLLTLSLALAIAVNRGQE